MREERVFFFVFVFLKRESERELLCDKNMFLLTISVWLRWKTGRRQRCQLPQVAPQRRSVPAAAGRLNGDASACLRVWSPKEKLHFTGVLFPWVRTEERLQTQLFRGQQILVRLWLFEERWKIPNVHLLPELLTQGRLWRGGGQSWRRDRR